MHSNSKEAGEMDEKELKQILERHGKWLRGEEAQYEVLGGFCTVGDRANV